MSSLHQSAYLVFRAYGAIGLLALGASLFITLGARPALAQSQVLNETMQLFASPGLPGVQIFRFGDSVAIDGITGDTAVVGAPATLSGRSYIFDLNTGNQLHETSGENPGDSYGSAVDIEGDRFIVGAGRFGPLESGAAYIYDTATGTEQSQVFGSFFNDSLFGADLSISGDRAFVSTHDDQYLFDVNTGFEIMKLTAPSTHEYNNGSAIDGDRAIIRGNLAGKPFHQATYIVDLATGDELFEFVLDEGKLVRDVAIQGNLAAATWWISGESGAYVYDITTGTQLFELDPIDSNNHLSVAMDGSLLVIGDWQGDGNSLSSGAAYVYDLTTGDELYKLIASEGSTGDNFGTSVAIDGNTVLVGAPEDDDNGNQDGAVYVFTVPEPSTFVLAAFAAIALGVARYRSAN